MHKKRELYKNVTNETAMHKKCELHKNVKNEIAMYIEYANNIRM